MTTETTQRTDVPQGLGGFVLVSMADVDRGRFTAQTYSAESLLLRTYSRSAAGNGGGVMSGPRLGIIPISGVLTKYGSEYGSSSDAIGSFVEAAANSGQFDGLMLLPDSPGGLTAGVYEANTKIAAASKKIPIHAHVDGLAASAALPLIVPAARVTLSKGSVMGSIGTYSSVDDSTEMFKQIGITRHVVKAGEHKADGMPGTPVTEKQIAERQRIVDAFNEHFIAAFAEGRNLPMATVRAMADGRVHVGQAAVDAGFADAVSTFDEAMAALADAVSLKASSKGTKTMSSETSTGPVSATLPQLKQAFPSAGADFWLGQLEAGATIEASHQAFAIDQRDKTIADQKASIEAKDAEISILKQSLETEQKARTEAEAKLAKAPAQKTAGTAPIGTTPAKSSAASEGGSARSQWQALMHEEQLANKGTSRSNIVAKLAKQHPDLHAQMLAEANNVSA